MKRLLLAGALVMMFALARAHDNAYVSLIGMADSAADDKGPQAGEIPPDDASAERGRENGSPGDAPKTAYGSARIEKPGAGPAATAAKRAAKSEVEPESGKDGDAPSVAVPVAAGPRVWTRLFASLLPSTSHASTFEIVLSTAVRKSRPAPARPATAASAAGSAQGVLELVALATAP